MICKDIPDDFPVFSMPNGKPLTQRKFNKILKDLTGHLFKNGKITGHSFRYGLVSLFANLGYSEEDLKRIGRWSSRAYLHYVKHGKSVQKSMAKDLKDIY